MVYVFSLSNLSFIFNYQMVGDQAVAADWHNTEDVLYVSALCNPKVYIINITANFSVNYFLYLNSN